MAAHPSRCSPQAPGPRTAVSPTSCARKPSAARCCCWPPSSPWSGRTRRGLGQLLHAAGHRDRTRRVAPEPDRRASGPATACWRSSSSSPGLELKREFVAGDLRDPKRAVVPVAAAVGGMIVPAMLYLAIAGGTGPEGGRSRPRPTSLSRSRFSRSSPPICRRRCGRSCSPWPWSTTCWRSPSSPCSIPTTCNRNGCCSRCCRLALFTAAGAAPGQCTGGVAAVGVCHLGAGARLRGARHRRRGAARFRRPGPGPEGRRQGRRPARAWPNTSSTSGGPSRPGSRSRCSRCSPPASLIGGWSGLQSALTDPIAIGIIAGLVLGKPIGILTATFLTVEAHPTAAAEGV